MPSCGPSLDSDDRVNVDERIAQIEYNMNADIENNSHSH